MLLLATYARDSFRADGLWRSLNRSRSPDGPTADTAVTTFPHLSDETCARLLPGVLPVEWRCLRTGATSHYVTLGSEIKYTTYRLC